MIVWVTGCTTSGKTWLGDFLQYYHGWVHAEGDKLVHSKADSEISKNVMTAFLEYWMKSKEAPFELWSKYYQNLCDQVHEIYREKQNISIVVTFSTYPRVVRDYVREQIKKSTGQELIFILLDVSREEYLTRSVVRLMDFVKTAGRTIEDLWEKNENMNKLGAYSEQRLKDYFLKEDFIQGLEPLREDEANSFTIDANENHVHVVPEVSRILNLRKLDDIDVDTVKGININRWKQHNESMDGEKRSYIIK